MKQDFIISWFAKNGTLTEDELREDLDINYFEKGLIDSFGFLELIETCEKELGISFSDDDFSNDEIFTISGLINILEEKVSVE